jgi:4-amino-4-deoxy-L-arabinose transferase-like glycosyltransferase
MKLSQISAIAGLALFVVLTGAWALSENASGRIPEGLSQVGHGIVYPGWFAAVVYLGNMHARFGDWRDFLVIVSVSWIIWMIPVLFVCRALMRRKKLPNRVAGSD